MDDTDEFESQLQMGKRLAEITQGVGFALWQLQTLEGALAQVYVLVALAQPGMGLEAAAPILDGVQAKTFGATIHKMVKGDHLPEPLASRFLALLAERNWLVHSSQADSRDALYHAHAYTRTLGRIEALGDEAADLLKEINKIALAFVKGHGISINRVNELVKQTLEAWHRGD